MQNMAYQYNNYVHGLKNEYGNIFIINNKQIKFLKMEKCDKKITTFHLIRCWQPLQLLSILYIDCMH